MIRNCSLFLLFIIIVGCKSTQKVKTGSMPQTSGRTIEDNRRVVDPESPLITSMNTRYVLQDSTSANIYLDLLMENFRADAGAAERFSNQFRVEWAEVTDYNIREKLKTGRLENTPETFSFVDNHVYISFKVPRPKDTNSAILITEFVDTNAKKKFTIDMPIDFVDARFMNRYGMYKNNPARPTFDTYVQLGEPITFKAVNGYERPFYLIHYEGDNQPARSPMSTTKPSVVGFRRISLEQYTSGQPLTLQNEGLYYAVEDTTDINFGSGFYVVDNRYPRLTMPEELSEATIYISTNTEIEGFKATDNYKQALDLFYLQLTKGDPDRSKEIIRNYYRRVAEANRLFTSHKEGWKTDKGMIFIVLGPPSRVQRFRDREVWLYSQSENLSEIIFTFYRTKNQFTDNYYELVRYPDYKQYWYPYVEAWRNGKITQ